MIYFRYEVADKKGRVMTGTMEAATQRDVVARLQERGFTIRQVAEEAPLTRAHETPDLIEREHVPSTQPLRIKGKVRERDLYFFFSQLASLLRSGIAPVEAMHGLAQRANKPLLRRVAGEMESAAGQGAPMSSVMEQYECFPRYAIGLIRSGEMSGYLPAATQELADQLNASVVYKRYFWIARFFTWQGIAALALGVALPPAMFAALTEGGTTSAGAMGAFWSAFGKVVLTRSLPICGGVVLLYYVIKWALSGEWGAGLRHRVLLKMPYGMGRRAAAESIRVFLFSLRNLYAAAVPPTTAWRMAADTVPNTVYEERLQAAAQVMESGGNVDQAAFATDLLPYEYSSLLATGHQAGDMVGMLDQAYKYSCDEFKVADARAKGLTFSIGCLAAILASGGLIIAIAQGYYNNVFDVVEKWINGP